MIEKQEKTTRFITNKFHVNLNNSERVEALLEKLRVLRSEEIDNQCDIEFGIIIGRDKEFDIDGNETLVYQVHGAGDLAYDDGTASENMLKMSGNMPNFTKDLSALTIDGIILMFTSSSDDGWVSSRGFAAFNGQYQKIDLSECLVASLIDMGCDKRGYEMRPVLD